MKRDEDNSGTPADRPSNDDQDFNDTIDLDNHYFDSYGAPNEHYCPAQGCDPRHRRTSAGGIVDLWE